MAKTTQQGVKDHLHVPNFEVPIFSRDPCHSVALAMPRAILDRAWSIASESLNDLSIGYQGNKMGKPETS